MQGNYIIAAFRETSRRELSGACDSDDMSYEKLHPQLVWRWTKTPGRGSDC